MKEFDVKKVQNGDLITSLTVTVFSSNGHQGKLCYSQLEDAISMPILSASDINVSTPIYLFIHQPVLT